MKTGDPLFKDDRSQQLRLPNIDWGITWIKLYAQSMMLLLCLCCDGPATAVVGETIRRGIPVPIRLFQITTCVMSFVVQPMAVPGPSSAENVDYSDIEKHEFAQYILREHGTYFPKWGTSERCIPQNHSHPHRSEDMSGFVESVPNVKQRIDQIQTQHTEQLEKLCARQAEQYLQDAADRYAAQNDEADASYSDAVDVRFS